MLAAYETQFLKAKQIAEKLYCDRCYSENRADGCRVGVTLNGFTAIARIECRCRILERKGVTH